MPVSFFQLCLLGSHDLRLRFHSKIWEAIEDHLEGEDPRQRKGNRNLLSGNRPRETPMHRHQSSA